MCVFVRVGQQGTERVMDDMCQSLMLVRAGKARRDTGVTQSGLRGPPTREGTAD